MTDALALLPAPTIATGANRGTIDGWRPPTVPYGYDALVVCLSDSGWELDFINERTRSFASEDMPELDIAWPWPPGFEPKMADWKRLGIDVVDFR